MLGASAQERKEFRICRADGAVSLLPIRPGKLLRSRIDVPNQQAARRRGQFFWNALSRRCGEMALEERHHGINALVEGCCAFDILREEGVHLFTEDLETKIR